MTTTGSYKIADLCEAAAGGDVGKMRRLQSFSDDFRFTGTYIQKSQQVGNAVPPLLMEAFAEDIRRCC